MIVLEWYATAIGMARRKSDNRFSWVNIPVETDNDIGLHDVNEDTPFIAQGNAGKPTNAITREKERLEKRYGGEVTATVSSPVDGSEVTL